jgi:hypothetical protein
MTTKQISQSLNSSSGTVAQNYKEFYRRLNMLFVTLAPERAELSDDARGMWLALFSKTFLEDWISAVSYILDTFDHMPVPVEIKRIIERIQAQKIDSLVSPQEQDNAQKLLPPKLSKEDYSEEYRQANLEFIKILADGLGQCLNLKTIKTREEKRKIWEEIEEEVTALHSRHQDLPAGYACATCWDTGWHQRQEGGYKNNYPCSCVKGFERQRQATLTTLKRYAAKEKKTLSQYLSSLSCSPFRVKAYPCIKVYDGEGKWDFNCQHQCDPQRIMWCFGKIEEIKNTGNMGREVSNANSCRSSRIPKKDF